MYYKVQRRSHIIVYSIRACLCIWPKNIGCARNIQVCEHLVIAISKHNYFESIKNPYVSAPKIFLCINREIFFLNSCVDFPLRIVIFFPGNIIWLEVHVSGVYHVINWTYQVTVWTCQGRLEGKSFVGRDLGGRGAHQVHDHWMKIAWRDG